MGDFVSRPRPTGKGFSAALAGIAFFFAVIPFFFTNNAYSQDSTCRSVWGSDYHADELLTLEERFDRLEATLGKSNALNLLREELIMIAEKIVRSTEKGGKTGKGSKGMQRGYFGRYSELLMMEGWARRKEQFYLLPNFGRDVLSTRDGVADFFQEGFFIELKSTTMPLEYWSPGGFFGTEATDQGTRVFLLPPTQKLSSKEWVDAYLVEAESKIFDFYKAAYESTSQSRYEAYGSKSDAPLVGAVNLDARHIDLKLRPYLLKRLNQILFKMSKNTKHFPNFLVLRVLGLRDNNILVHGVGKPAKKEKRVARLKRLFSGF